MSADVLLSGGVSGWLGDAADGGGEHGDGREESGGERRGYDGDVLSRRVTLPGRVEGWSSVRM